ncbi:hypothetical protein [Microvirga massiliensis]|uniref:hypothetical protein n=1 Tax=Microvirga massiliensis TaxID=1033741 RepID=UPI00062B6A6B|nr:hypothetical protein [Microvirga massiliensis]
MLRYEHRLKVPPTVTWRAMGNPPQDLTWFEFEPDDRTKPNEIRFRVSSPRDNARYIDRIVTAVGFGIYLGGYNVYCEGIELPIFVPEHMVDFTLGVVSEASNDIFDSLDAAKAAAIGGSNVKPAVAYFWGAGGAVVAPTIICPATTPQIIATMRDARSALVACVEEQLTAVALSIVGGMIIKAVISRIVGVRRGAKEPGSAPSKIPKIRAKNDQINVGGALEKGSEQFTNLNPVNPLSGGATKGIPNHIKGSFEEIGEIFEPGTVKCIISNRLRFGDVKDWNAAAQGSFKVMRSGGRIGAGHPASGLNVWATADEVPVLLKAFQQAGFRDVKNVGTSAGPGVVIQAIKP